MNVIAVRGLKEFWRTFPDSEGQLKAWYHEVVDAAWMNSAQVKAHYATASILNSERVVFNICGNKYRLVARINYRSQTVFICFLGTHAEYDRIDPEKISWSQRS